ncbi:STAS domain-containing protein [Mycolicibacterium sp. CH28]|uniref:STAS domain-containing protein n=1 Tax=Mycolicibacterium sp. CH28 TaxID=2512237 RepID=UPI001386C953|nr:STAS domain-containing protein [Mycolicibacterium sp. CH28]
MSSRAERPTANAGEGTRNRLQLFTEWLNPTDVRISAVGHIDMSTADQFTEYVFRRAGNCQRLMLDLCEVTFFDCAGFSALCYIDDRCHMANVTWTIESTHCVSRVVGFCDPLQRLPLVMCDDVARRA